MHWREHGGIRAARLDVVVPPMLDSAEAHEAAGKSGGRRQRRQQQLLGPQHQPTQMQQQQQSPTPLQQATGAGERREQREQREQRRRDHHAGGAGGDAAAAEGRVAVRRSDASASSHAGGARQIDWMKCVGSSLEPSPPLSCRSRCRSCALPFRVCSPPAKGLFGSVRSLGWPHPTVRAFHVRLSLGRGAGLMSRASSSQPSVARRAFLRHGGWRGSASK